MAAMDAPEPMVSALLGALVGGAAAAAGAYLALRNRASAAERARMATEIMYHVMTGLVLLEEGLAAVEEVLLEREKGGGKGPRDAAERLRKQLDGAFAGYDPLRPHVDYRVGKLMRLPGPAMGMLDELEHRMTEAFNLWDGGRLLHAAAKGDDDRVVRFDELVKRSSEDVRKFAAVLRRV